MAWSIPRDWTNGEIVTQTMLNTDVRDNMRELFHEMAYVEFAAAVSITATTDATANTIVSAGAVTYPANPMLIEFYSPKVETPNTASLTLTLWDASSDLGRLATFQTPSSTQLMAAGVLIRRLTPTAASHTYIVKAFVSVGTGTVHAGAGGTGVFVPGYIRVLQKGGT